MSDVRVDSSAARQRIGDMGAALITAAALALKSVVDVAEASAKTTTLFRDGPDATTRKSIKPERTGQFTARLEAGGAAKYLENGTPPHRIDHAVYINGVGFRYIGMHPGTMERPFMAQARAKAAQAAEYAAEFYIDYALKRL